MTSTTSPVTELVTDEQIAFFRENGYLHYGALWNEAEQQELREEIQRFIDGDYPDCYRTDLWPQGEAQAPPGQERFLQMCGLYKHSEVIRRFAIQKRRGEIVAALVGCDSIQLLSDMILYKPPGKGKSRPYPPPTSPTDRAAFTSRASCRATRFIAGSRKSNIFIKAGS
jgi:hypothetical protein